MTKQAITHTIIGIIIGVLLTSGISVIADNIYNVVQNPYPVAVNGEIKNIEGYNINDSTYFKLRDIGRYVGFDVGFSEGVISINEKDNTTNNSNEIVSIDNSNQRLIAVQTNDDVYYSVTDLNNGILTGVRIDVQREDDNSYILTIIDIGDGKETVVGNLDYKILYGELHISKTDLDNKVLPYN